MTLGRDTVTRRPEPGEASICVAPRGGRTVKYVPLTPPPRPRLGKNLSAIKQLSVKRSIQLGNSGVPDIAEGAREGRGSEGRQVSPPPLPVPPPLPADVAQSSFPSVFSRSERRAVRRSNKNTLFY